MPVSTTFNRMIKVHSGLVRMQILGSGSSLEMSHLSSQFKGQFGLQVNKPEGHHDVQPSVIQQEYQAVEKSKLQY